MGGPRARRHRVGEYRGAEKAHRRGNSDRRVAEPARMGLDRDLGGPERSNFARRSALGRRGPLAVRAAAGDTCDWVSAKHIARWHRAPSSRIPPGLEGNQTNTLKLTRYNLDLCEEL